MTRRAALAATLAGALPAAMPGAAAGQVAPGSGIGGVTPGHSDARARAASRRPPLVVRGTGALGPVRDLGHPALTMRPAGRRGATVVGVSASNPRRRTGGGVGVGSARAGALIGIVVD